MNYRASLVPLKSTAKPACESFFELVSGPVMQRMQTLPGQLLWQTNRVASLGRAHAAKPDVAGHR